MIQTVIWYKVAAAMINIAYQCFNLTFFYLKKIIQKKYSYNLEKGFQVKVMIYFITEIPNVSHSFKNMYDIIRCFCA